MAKKAVKGKTKDTISLLLENTIILQKTLTSLASELKTLNKKVSSMVSLFEQANKTFKEDRVKGTRTGLAGSSEILEKINILEKQNRTIAKGLILLEKTISGLGTIEARPLRPKKVSIRRVKKLKPLAPKKEKEEVEEPIEEEENESEELPEFSL